MKGKSKSIAHVPKGLRLHPEGPGTAKKSPRAITSGLASNKGSSQTPDPALDMARFRRRVLRLVASIPQGRVATYGQISALAGHPRRARHVGQALGGPHAPDLPWFRVINAQGRVSARAGEPTRKGPPPERRQQKLLEAEGVVFRKGVLDLERYRWKPEEEGGGLLAALAKDV